MLQVTNFDLEKIIKDKGFNYKDDFFAQQAFLSVSGQLEGEAYAQSHGEIYTFAPTFRADPSDTPRHLSEFWMIEPEMAFYDFEDLKILIEDFIKHLISETLIQCKDELKFLDEFVTPNLLAKLNDTINGDFEEMTFEKAVSIINNSKKKFENRATMDTDLFLEHERYLVDEVFKKPIFITNYPKSFKSFYMKANDDDKTVRCLDLLVPGIGEIITGSQREDNYNSLLQRISDKNMDVSAYEWYLDTRKWGTCPHSGFGLGFERMILYLTGMKNIKDVIPFPRAMNSVY